MSKCGNEINPGQLNQGNIARDCGRICKDYGAKTSLFTFKSPKYCRCSEDVDNAEDCKKGGSKKSYRYLGTVRNINDYVSILILLLKQIYIHGSYF